MNLVSDNYFPGGPTCTYKGKKVPCLVDFSGIGGISGHIIVNILNPLDALEMYDNDRQNDILPVLFVNGHGSNFDLGFLQYIFDENHKHTTVFGVTYETKLRQLVD